MQTDGKPSVGHTPTTRLPIIPQVIRLRLRVSAGLLAYPVPKSTFPALASGIIRTSVCRHKPARASQQRVLPGNLIRFPIKRVGG